MKLFRAKSADAHWEKRVKKTSGDTSSESIPKVADAGEVKEWNGAPVQIMHNGVRVFAGGYHGQPMVQIIRNLRGHHEPQEEKVFNEILKRMPSDATMIEVGCFWSYYSLWFSHEMPERKNYLIEPVSWKAALGCLNFALNDKTAVIDRYYIQDDSVDLATSAGAGEESLSGAKPITLDDYAREKGIRHIDMLHADIQGAELALLQGADHLLKRQRIDFVFLSTHKGRHDSCKQLLNEYNYKLLNEHTIQKGSGYDGLVVAASPSVVSDSDFSL